jgi:hypothetical protein
MAHTNKQSIVYLEPIEHKYFNRETGEQYTSISAILGKYKSKFEEDKIASAIARRDGRKKEDIIAEWRLINKEATDFGTYKVHNPIEDYIKAKGFYFPTDDYEKQVINAFKSLDLLGAETVMAEECLWVDEYKVAGTSDLVLDYGDFFDINDYKSNKKLTYRSEYSKWMLGCLSHLSDCSYNAYAIQLSFYAYMYQLRTGKKLRELKILWWNRETMNFDRVPLPYMKYEVLEILKEI